MKTVYERENLRITEFDTEDVITTSGVTPTPDVVIEKDNRHISFNSFDGTPGSWF